MRPSHTVAAVASVLCVAYSFAQTPDLVIKADVSLNNLSLTNGGSRVRWYDPLGRHSIVGIRLTLEPGYYLLVTERLQRIDRDADREFIDEAYVEDPGSWRIGRQYLPFGNRVLYREAALAARFDRQFTVKGLPVEVAVCDNGSGKQRGIIGRVGSQIGASLAVGEHFGIAGTCFTPFRLAEASPGAARGHAFLVGIDANRNVGPANVALEYVGMRRGATVQDVSDDATDLRLLLRSFEGKSRLTVAWTRLWRGKVDYYRVEDELQISRNISLRSLVRFQRGSFSDLGIGVRVKF